MLRTLFVFCLISGAAIVIAACVIHLQKDDREHPLSPGVLLLKTELAPLDLEGLAVHTPAFEEYRKYYHLNFEDAEHVWGTISSETYQIATHIFIPPAARATVFLVHGYLDHVGRLAPLIQDCLDRQLIVVAYDLPGHGLSSGKRAYIDSFEVYAAVFQDVFRYCRGFLPTPYYVIGHSTGSSIVLEFLRQREQQPFRAIVFLAPLIHHRFWRLSKFAYALAKPFRVKSIPRKRTPPSTNPEFVSFATQDPMQNARVPLRWVAEVFEWNREIHDMDVLALPLMLIQGTHDSIVDWKYNIPFLQAKIQGLSVRMIEGAEHQLIHEPPALQHEVFHAIDEWFDAHQ